MNETYTTFTDKMRKAFRAFGETCSRYLLGIGLMVNAVTRREIGRASCRERV